MPLRERGQPGRCPSCGAQAKLRACPQCHTALPIDLVDSAGPVIGLAGSVGSGKTVLMTVLVNYLREVIGRRYGADIRIAIENPDGYDSLFDYYASRERPLLSERVLGPITSSAAMRRPTPIIMRWRQEMGQRIGGSTIKSTILSLVDTSGSDLNDMETTFLLQHLSTCSSLIITIDPFALRGARTGLDLPSSAIQADDPVALEVLARITEFLRIEHGIRQNKKIPVPVVITFTKMDAFYPSIDPQSRIAAISPGAPAYADADGLAVHEQMRALMHEWNATVIDRHLQANYADYRYFAVSALGGKPDYARAQVAPSGVQPHRVEDPVLWLLTKTGTVPLA